MSFFFSTERYSNQASCQHLYKGEPRGHKRSGLSRLRVAPSRQPLGLGARWQTAGPATPTELRRAVGRAMALLLLGLTLSGSPARADAAADRRRGAADRPVGAARRADPCRRQPPPPGRRPAALLEVVRRSLHGRRRRQGRAPASSRPRSAIVVGFLCTESIEAAMPILKDAGIPVITVGVRTDSLTDRREQDRLAGVPAGAARRRRAQRRGLDADPELWRDTTSSPSSTTARSMAASSPKRCAPAAEKAALKPVFVDTFRPQLDNQIGLAGRLRKAGATHVFVGGDRDDIAIIGRDAGRARADDLPLPAARRCAPPPGDVAAAGRHADDRPAGMGRRSPPPAALEALCGTRRSSRKAMRCRPMRRWRSPTRPMRTPSSAASR